MSSLRRDAFRDSVIQALQTNTFNTMTLLSKFFWFFRFSRLTQSPQSGQPITCLCLSQYLPPSSSSSVSPGLHHQLQTSGHSPAQKKKTHRVFLGHSSGFQFEFSSLSAWLENSTTATKQWVSNPKNKHSLASSQWQKELRRHAHQVVVVS